MRGGLSVVVVATRGSRLPAVPSGRVALSLARRTPWAPFATTRALTSIEVPLQFVEAGLHGGRVGVERVDAELELVVLIF